MPSPRPKVTGAVPVDVTAALIPRNPKSSFETGTYLQAGISMTSKIPSLSSSKSMTSGMPSPSVSKHALMVFEMALIYVYVPV
ncbi:unannotated protein [freshwater metagenome]|uniref:Unannotated protein n=1 Tax=freshwater metagenome TaxID=449393 RepID=A0A6J6UB31_9ZZZZ